MLYATGMLPWAYTCRKLCREKEQPTISKATVSVLHWYGSMKITLLTQLCQNMAGFERLSLCVFVQSKKKTHTRSEDLQNHVFDLTHLQLDNPVLYSYNMVSIEPGCVGCILKPLASGGASFSRTGHSLRWTKGTFNFCVDVLSVLVYCPVCGLGVNQGNNQSEMGWTGPGWSHRAAHNSCSGQFKDRSTEQSEGVSNSMAWTGEAFLFYIFPCEHCFHITIHMCCWYTPPRCPDHSYPHYSPQVACLPAHVGA